MRKALVVGIDAYGVRDTLGRYPDHFRQILELSTPCALTSLLPRRYPGAFSD
jgi:hypothetical protein